jgi:hypothetical protein
VVRKIPQSDNLTSHQLQGGGAALVFVSLIFVALRLYLTFQGRTKNSQYVDVWICISAVNNLAFFALVVYLYIAAYDNLPTRNMTGGDISKVRHLLSHKFR